MAVLAYGYWFAATHASLWISVDDVSDASRVRGLYDVEMGFLDADGHVLARATGSSRSGTIALTSPAEYGCSEIEAQAAFGVEARETWQRCFARQSLWIPTWIERTAAIDLHTGTCDLRRVPVRIARHGGEWWIWWVPLPHVGGKPYSLFSVAVGIDLQRCVAA